MEPNVPHWPHSTCPNNWWENTENAECVEVLINLTKGSYNSAHLFSSSLGPALALNGIWMYMTAMYGSENIRSKQFFTLTCDLS